MKHANSAALSFGEHPRVLRWLAFTLSALMVLFIATVDVSAQVKNKPRASNSNIPKLTGHGGPVRAVFVTPDGKYALSAGSLDYTMIYWALSGIKGRIVHKFDAHNAPVSAVAMVPGGAMAFSASDGGALSLWDLKPESWLNARSNTQEKSLMWRSRAMAVMWPVQVGTGRSAYGISSSSS